MTSMERVLAALGHREPDRVPLVLTLTTHGARELSMPLAVYFSRAENVAEGQLRLWRKYGHDALYSFFYAPIEIEAMGGEVIRREDGPFTSGTPFLRGSGQVMDYEPPCVANAPRLQEVTRAIALMKKEVGDEVPILGVVMSPFSLPVMQMGFEGYLDLLYDDQEAWFLLMRKNIEFCVTWANAQFEAGATMVAYFDPLSSPTCVPRELFRNTGWAVAKKTLAQFKGPYAYHLASARGIPILEEIIETKSLVVSSTILEDLGATKSVARGRIAVLGNLNGIEMRRWKTSAAEQAVKTALAQAAPGGGFILSDQHGEIPWQVPDEAIMAVADANRRWGTYPLTWAQAAHG